jgi:hypothetical protein
MSDLSGRWEGLLVDTAGVQQRAEFDLDEKDGGIEGSAGLTVVDTHEREQRRAKVEGGHGRGARARGEGDGDDDVELSIRTEDGGTFTFRGRSGDPGQHAEAVVYGTYEVSGAKDLPASAGVAILWRYKQIGG